MDFEELQPTSVRDLIIRSEDYINYMRTLEHEETTFLLDNLEEHITYYFESTRLDMAKFKVEVLEMLNDLYITICNLEVRDEETDSYYGITLAYLFEKIKEQGVHLFFLHDTELSNERFLLVVELFQLIGFSTITPYNDTDENVTDAYTDDSQTFPPREYSDVYADLEQAIEDDVDILYIENGQKISYIQRIVDIASKLYPDYLCLYRNKQADTKQALWLKGDMKVVINE